MIPHDVKQAFRMMGNAIFVVTAEHNGVVRGFTASWLAQASYENPYVMASFSKKHDTYQLIAASGQFTVNVLSKAQVQVSKHFGRKSGGPDELDYLAGYGKETPFLIPGALAALQCQVVGALDAEDHTVFLARVTAARAGGEGEPLFWWQRGGYAKG